MAAESNGLTAREVEAARLGKYEDGHGLGMSRLMLK